MTAMDINLINRTLITKFELCELLHQRGERGYLYPVRLAPRTDHSKAIYKYRSRPSKLWKVINSDPDLMDRLGWKNKTRFIQVHSGYFSARETRILIDFFKLEKLEK